MQRTGRYPHHMRDRLHAIEPGPHPGPGPPRLHLQNRMFPQNVLQNLINMVVRHNQHMSIVLTWIKEQPTPSTWHIRKAHHMLEPPGQPPVQPPQFRLLPENQMPLRRPARLKINTFKHVHQAARPRRRDCRLYALDGRDDPCRA